LEGNSRGLIEVLLRNLPGETEEYHEELRIAGVLAEISIDDLRIKV
jgi:hypothetical protein